MLSMYEKEIKLYFLSLQGYIFIGTFLLISGYFFITYNVLGSNSDIAVMLDNSIVSFILIIPMLTMQLFAEERHMKTDKLYMSASISITRVVLGKYFAAYSVYVLAVLISSISSFTMVVIAGAPLGETLCIYFGYLLIGSSFVAVGMFVSAIAENQVVAAVVSFGVCFILYIADWLLDFSMNSVLTFIVKAISVTTWYGNFLIGIFDMVALIYFLTITSLFIFFTVMKTESRRWK